MIIIIIIIFVMYCGATKLKLCVIKCHVTISEAYTENT